MAKKNWPVSTPGYAPFPMLTLDDALDHAGGAGLGSLYMADL